ncbi:unnamed protein product [Orchesella dallaii]|uniref:Uncharacterized protein n=1 Tax=Orchesella dallaii TaxID=48710 RepID=A0ABP1PND2_9HEXA
MGEPGTSGGEGGSGGGNSGASSSSAAEAGAGGIDCSAAGLDPAVVASMTADELKKFIETGRTGRRNALHDVSEGGAITTSTASVTEALESLNVGDTSGKSPEGAQGGS